MSDSGERKNGLTRRAFVSGGSLFLLGAGVDWPAAARLFAAEDQDPRTLRDSGDLNPAKSKLRFGLITDLHYADKTPAGSRHYRETLTKLSEAADRFRQDKVDFVAELGDFIDAADSVQTEKSYLRRINKDFAALPGKKHYVLGNHCVDTLTKREFLDEVGQQKSFYSFDAGGYHFVVLDACFRSDGTPYGRKNFKWTDPNIPAGEIDWIRSDLKETGSKTILFVHQRLDVSDHYGIKNAKDVRKVLEESGRVVAVFQGHAHKNDHKQIAGIHYCTLKAMVDGSGAENNAYATADIFEDGTIRVTGFRQQKSHNWTMS